MDRDARPRKGLQDCLDSAICLLVAARWLCDRARCVMIGDLKDGYIVAPVGPTIHARLAAAADKEGVTVAHADA